MQIRCWGSRGSVAVSGKEYLKYGGDTTCVEIESADGDLIIIDAGTGIRGLGNKIIKEAGERTIHLLFTHSHWDHLSGFPFFKPIYSAKSNIKIYGPRATQDSLKSIISRTMEAPYFPVEFADVGASLEFLEKYNLSFNIGPICIDSIPLSHTNPGVGYRLKEAGKSFVFLTDNELTLKHPEGRDFADYVEFSKGADLLFHDAEFLPEEYKLTKGWGHSVYLDALKMAMDAGARSFGMFHLNQDRYDDQADEMLDDCKRIINENGNNLDAFVVSKDQEFYL